MPTSGDKFSRNYDIVAETRRKFSEEEKASIIAEAASCSNISALARRRGLRPNFIYSISLKLTPFLLVGQYEKLLPNLSQREVTYHCNQLAT